MDWLHAYKILPVPTSLRPHHVLDKALAAPLVRSNQKCADLVRIQMPVLRFALTQTKSLL